MNSAKIVKEGVQVNSCERTNTESKGDDINDSKAENVKVEIVDTASFKPIFLNWTWHVDADCKYLRITTWLIYKLRTVRAP